MAINWDILFAHNQGRAAVDGVSKLMQEMADREQKEREMAQNNSYRMGALQQQQMEYNTTGRSQAESEIAKNNAYTDYMGQQVGLEQSKNEQSYVSDIYKAQLQAQQKEQEDQRKQQQWEADQRAKQLENDRRYGLDVDKYGLDVRKAEEDKLRTQEELRIKNAQLGYDERRVGAYETQVANASQGTSWMDLYQGPVNKTDIEAKNSITRSIDGTGWYDPDKSGAGNYNFILSQ